jgi:hypothetical protein
MMSRRDGLEGLVLTGTPRNNTWYEQHLARAIYSPARGKLNGLSRYFFCTEGHGAPQGAQAPAKSSGETGRPLDGEVRCSATIAVKPTMKTMA